MKGNKRNDKIPEELPACIIMQEDINLDTMPCGTESLSIADAKVLSLLIFRPRLMELVLLAFTLFASIAKLIFSVAFVLILAYPDAMQLVISDDFDGSLYVAHASLYLIIAFSSVINAVMMLVNRLEVSFYVQPELLRYYIILDSLAIVLQIAVYGLFNYDHGTDTTSIAIGNVLGLLLIMDIFKSLSLTLFECNIHTHLNRLKVNVSLVHARLL